MTQYDPETDPRLEGQRRYDRERARQEASAKVMTEMLSGAGQAEHQDTSRQLRAAHQGLFPYMTPEQRGQLNAELPMTVGSAWGQPRAVEQLGGTLGHANEGPAPASFDLTRVNDRPGFQQGQQPGMSPLAAYMQGRQ